MNQMETKFFERVPRYLERIEKQLKIMNQLKALELKGRLDLKTTPEMVDDIVKG